MNWRIKPPSDEAMAALLWRKANQIEKPKKWRTATWVKNALKCYDIKPGMLVQNPETGDVCEFVGFIGRTRNPKIIMVKRISDLDNLNVVWFCEWQKFEGERPIPSLPVPAEKQLRTPPKYLDEEKVREIRKIYANSRKPGAVRLTYSQVGQMVGGLTEFLIRKVVKREIWAEVK